MGKQRGLPIGQFIGDDGGIHNMVSSSVIAAVPAAREAAVKYGREVRFDFLDNVAVHWMLFHRWEDNRRWRRPACLAGLPLFVFTFGAWPFWDLVASQQPRAFQIAFICLDALIVLGMLLGLYLWRRPSLRDPSLRNVRIRARHYHQIVGIARRGGADIPTAYPYFGMHASARKFFPDAPELPTPETDKSA
ncbi:hypothetical protein [Streptomyces tsukubensis]|uniref:Uncharacterized protein n=1 Tax=Streptomyces tsukubensis TaxID=83656 RepID=A0A1V4AAI5_9ACTN|nr:hypothetical protein [Streptomyces tsukubensis]OON80802.1 hypothetical protein B1H18_10415 [Streptomyces tsukubensis]QFR93557.1 hypothetical protein GBW32_11250 [Streptomyces tsukubensis]